ncbi:MAG TPA: FAD-dependent oxidoreductase, partial [Pirellulales bacterium]|nr:FAD-dependent oxidoreductase [Pirellulales bacterium]
MSTGAPPAAPRVVIVGGGLAGLAAATALCTSGCRVAIFEARRALGGRAASFRDSVTGEMVDHCQHVGMGCCTNLEDFCRRLEIDDCIRRDEVLTFIGPAGRQHRFQAARWLPAPLHLGPAFFRLSYLSLRDRVGIGRALWALMRLKVSDDCQSPTIGRWLSQRGQSAAAIQHFWSVVLTSALGESLDRASLAAARKVLVDGFLAAPGAYALEIPQVPLGVLYGARMQDWLTARGVELHFQSPIRRIERDEGLVAVASDGRRVRGESIVVALPWSKMREVFSHDLAEQLPWLDHLQQ